MQENEKSIRRRERIDKIGFGNLEIIQNPEQFCYGVDAVLLSEMAAKYRSAKGNKIKRVCDLGTGNGIIPLIMSHKIPESEILGVEVQKEVFQLAKRNVSHNGLENRIKIENFNVTDITKIRESNLSGTFDIVTSNPPYTAAGSGMQCANPALMIARHEIEGTLDDFVRCAGELLCYRGDFFMVHRPSRLVDICQTCRKYRLEPKDMLFVSPKPGSKANILLIHCIKDGKAELNVLPELNVRNGVGEYTERVLKAYEKA